MKKQMTILGVNGELVEQTERTVKGLWLNQSWKSEKRIAFDDGTHRGDDIKIWVKIRFDDNCKNGHNDFAITSIMSDGSGGCQHDEIAKYFPELAPLIKWHLVSTDGPMHYISNTVFAATNRDCYGLLLGEKKQIINGRTGKPCWHRAIVDNDGNEYDSYDLMNKNVEGDEPPASVDLKVIWAPWCRTGEGKERDLDGARRVAVWPEATDEILCGDSAELTKALEARLPQLKEEFKAVIKSTGLLWSPAEVGEV